MLYKASYLLKSIMWFNIPINSPGKSSPFVVRKVLFAKLEKQQTYAARYFKLNRKTPCIPPGEYLNNPVCLFAIFVNLTSWRKLF
ncbi:hypothetical protein CHISP_0781 [Chitinispirillum alkaliphilum]|nr:hypothetical protein CHISP_0781 [Chitinispirillum alkaliphilum]